MSMIQQFWKDDDAALISAELVCVMTILVLGMIVGLASVRDGVTTEAADLASAIGALNQSYSFGGVTGHHAVTPGSLWTDNVDDCDQIGAGNSACVLLCTTVSNGEGG